MSVFFVILMLEEAFVLSNIFSSYIVDLVLFKNNSELGEYQTFRENVVS